MNYLPSTSQLRRFVTLVIITLLTGTLASCSSPSRIVNSWSDNDAIERLEDVLVVGVAHRTTVRKLFENSFSESLQKNGVNALSSHAVQGMEDVPDREMVLKGVQTTGVRSVLLTRLADYSTKTLVQESVGREYMVLDRAPMEPIFFDPAPSYSSTTKTVVNLESRLYDAATGKLLWSATSELYNPVMTRDYIDNATKSFLQDMQKNGLF